MLQGMEYKTIFLSWSLSRSPFPSKASENEILRVSIFSIERIKFIRKSMKLVLPSHSILCLPFGRVAPRCPALSVWPSTIRHIPACQGRRHGFSSGGTNRRQVANLHPKYPKNRKSHRIWATSFSNLEGMSPPKFVTGGRVPLSPPLSTPMLPV